VVPFLEFKSDSKVIFFVEFRNNSHYLQMGIECGKSPSLFGWILACSYVTVSSGD